MLPEVVRNPEFRENAVELGELQLEVMKVVWELGDATAAQVHERLQDRRPVAYTTVLSTMRNLERREMLDHRVEGKAHRFFPQVTRGEFTQHSVRKLVSRLFAGQPKELLSHLLGDEKISEAERQRIRELLEDGEVGP